MKSKKIPYSLVAASLLIVAWMLSGVRITVDVDVILGFGVVATLLAIGAQEYSAGPKRLTIK